MSKNDTAAEHDVPVQYMSYTSGRVSPVPQMNHYPRDRNIALVESPTESCDAATLLNPAHETIAGRTDDVDSYLVAARERIVVADSNKSSVDKHLPYTEDEPAYGHVDIYETQRSAMQSAQCQCLTDTNILRPRIRRFGTTRESRACRRCKTLAIAHLMRLPNPRKLAARKPCRLPKLNISLSWSLTNATAK